MNDEEALDFKTNSIFSHPLINNSIMTLNRHIFLNLIDYQTNFFLSIYSFYNKYQHCFIMKNK